MKFERGEYILLRSAPESDLHSVHSAVIHMSSARQTAVVGSTCVRLATVVVQT